MDTIKQEGVNAKAQAALPEDAPDWLREMVAEFAGLIASGAVKPDADPSSGTVSGELKG